MERVISLKGADLALQEFRIQKSSEIKLHNDNTLAILNFTIIQVASGKRMLTIKRFNPGQSVNLAFDREGSYLICYSTKRVGMESKDSCLQLNVFGLTPA